MIRRLLIANRGEIAVRIIRACRELGIESVAVHSDVDAASPHVRAADRAVLIGPAPAIESYLSIARIIEAARTSGADAIHPGYGFLSQNAVFADACADAGLTFVGPPGAVLARMGSKIEARRLVHAAGVPIVPGETPDDQTDAGLARAVDRVGLPALIKASAGGGGKGMRRVERADEVESAVQAARREAVAAFGDGTLYVERLIVSPRHIEVQVLADHHGRTVHLFERDCSTQRRHQKVIEESPAPGLAADLRGRLTAAAVKVAEAAAYRNAGTVEFLVDGDSFYFLEMNARLQVEHPVTEQVTGVDLVAAQLTVAGGGSLPWEQHAITHRGHAVEARIYAEDPANGFLPQAGRLIAYHEPHWPGVRVDSGVVEGSEIPVYYDPLIAKVIATAETRPLAINRLVAALRELEIEGIRTNRAFLIQVLQHGEFREGGVDTGFLDRHPDLCTSADGRGAGPSGAATRDDLKVVAYNDKKDRGRDYDPWDTGGRGIPAVSTPSSPMPVRRTAAHVASAITAPMPATVIKINVKPGDRVKKGDTLLLLEAMKMELPIRAPSDGTVEAVGCREGELVQVETVLVRLA